MFPSVPFQSYAFEDLQKISALVCKVYLFPLFKHINKTLQKGLETKK